MPDLYIIAGCNGAGKTTASFTVLPEMLNCKEFVNADCIAAGISPFNQESVAFEAGRIMLKRIHQLIEEKLDFGFETTLSAKNYVSLARIARGKGYDISLIYLWLSSSEFAKRRVSKRLIEGGHNIPGDIIERRYYRGIYNLLNLYIPICDNWIVIENMNEAPEEIARGKMDGVRIEKQSDIWSIIIRQSKYERK